MKLILTALTLIFSSHIEASSWGSKITKTDSITLSKAITDVKKESIVVKAKVGKVCKKKGCWMVLETQKKDVRVTFDNYAFFVPMSLIGKTVLVEGKLSEYEMDVKEARHFAEDEGKKDVHKIKTPVKEYRMVATGVKLL